MQPSPAVSSSSFSLPAQLSTLGCPTCHCMSHWFILIIVLPCFCNITQYLSSSAFSLKLSVSCPTGRIPSSS
jgi:hypothetical protein